MRFDLWRIKEGVEPHSVLKTSSAWKVWIHCYFYSFAHGHMPAVLNEIQIEDGLVYTKAVTQNKDGKIISKKYGKILLPIKMNQ